MSIVAVAAEARRVLAAAAEVLRRSGFSVLTVRLSPAEVRRLARRANSRSQLWTARGRLALDSRSRSCSIREAGRRRVVGLTPSEYVVLRALIDAREAGAAWEDLCALLDRSGSREPAPLRLTVSQHVCRIRRKLGGMGRLLASVRGYGYRWDG